MILALGWPLAHLTRQETATATETSTVSEAPSQLSKVALEVETTLAPTAFAVLHLGAQIWHEQTPAPLMKREIELPYPPEGIELEVQLTWPGDTLAAARVKLTAPDGETHERTIWGRGETSEVLVFP